MGNPLVKNLVLPINEHITYTVDFGGECVLAQTKRN